MSVASNKHKQINLLSAIKDAHGYFKDTTAPPLPSGAGGSAPCETRPGDTLLPRRHEHWWKENGYFQSMISFLRHLHVCVLRVFVFCFMKTFFSRFFFSLKNFGYFFQEVCLIVECTHILIERFLFWKLQCQNKANLHSVSFFNFSTVWWTLASSIQTLSSLWRFLFVCGQTRDICSVLSVDVFVSEQNDDTSTRSLTNVL